MIPVPETTRRLVLEGFVRAQWLSAQAGGGRVEERATSRYVRFSNPAARPDWVYPGCHDDRAWEAAEAFVSESQSQSRPCLLLVDESSDPARAQATVERLDLRAVGTERCMLLTELSRVRAEAPAGVFLEVVSDEAGRQALVQTSASIFEASVEVFELCCQRGWWDPTPSPGR